MGIKPTAQKMQRHFPIYKLYHTFHIKENILIGNQDALFQTHLFSMHISEPFSESFALVHSGGW